MVENYTVSFSVPVGSGIFVDSSAVNSSCIWLQWNHVDENQVHGPFTGYNIQFDKTNGDSHNGDLDIGPVNQTVVCGLHTFELYEFELRARNEMFTGNAAHRREQITGEGGSQ